MVDNATFPTLNDGFLFTQLHDRFWLFPENNLNRNSNGLWIFLFHTLIKCCCDWNVFLSMLSHLKDGMVVLGSCQRK